MRKELQMQLETSVPVWLPVWLNYQSQTMQKELQMQLKTSVPVWPNYGGVNPSSLSIVDGADRQVPNNAGTSTNGAENPRIRLAQLWWMTNPREYNWNSMERNWADPLKGVPLDELQIPTPAVDPQNPYAASDAFFKKQKRDMVEEADENWKAAVDKLRSQNKEPLTLTSFGTLINNHETLILQWMIEGNYQRGPKPANLSENSIDESSDQSYPTFPNVGWGANIVVE
ncbi:MAG: hypothetical protein Q9171_002971 [Xanthocarpia ochracea]